MALDVNDITLLRSMENGMSPYEQFKTQQMAAKSHTGGVAIAGLTVGVVGAVAGITAWIFGPMYGNAKAAQAKEVAVAAKEQATLLASGTQRQLDQLTSLFAAERQERIAGDLNITTTINDSVQGSQSGQLTATQQAELSQAQQLMFGLSTGEYSKNPQRVALYQDATPCPCPASGCGCGCQG